MNDTLKHQRVQRIAVTLDAFDFSTQVLETALRLASITGAQIEGIFVEDIDLLQLAELPFVREVRVASRTEAVMSTTRMEQEFRVLARRAERYLREAAARYNVTCSFSIWRGSIDCELPCIATEADVLALTRLGTRLAYKPAARSSHNGIAVLCDGSEASCRALETAASIARDPYVRLDVLLQADTAGLRQQVQHRLRDQPGDIRIIKLPDDSLTALLDTLVAASSAGLIIERGNRLLQTPALRQRLNSLDCSLLIVR